MKYKSIYLIGIGGIGMSALARYYKHLGCFVAGYDKTETSLTRQLINEGIEIHYNDDVKLIPQECKKTENTLVIYTPAVPNDLRELCFFNNNKFDILKRSKTLGKIAKHKRTLAISGTHGKTTITTLLSHILTVAGDGCTAFLGGISKNYNTNLLLSHSQNLVAEADEFDRSFLQLFPYAAVITATDADHLDIYGSAEEVKRAFEQFAEQVKPNGYLIVRENVEIKLPKNNIKIYRYSYNKPCDFYASNIIANSNARYSFDINMPDQKICNCKLGIPGWINIENAVAACALAWTIGFDPEKLKLALASFTGVKRRFDLQINTDKIVYIDDYAHHPEELRVSISSIKKMYPKRKLTVIFQPHLYTRTRDFASEFAQSLSLADEVILLDIYPARELPIDGITSKIIFDSINCEKKTLCTKDELMKILETKKIDVLVTLGAGNIDLFIKPITEMLNKKLKNE